MPDGPLGSGAVRRGGAFVAPLPLRGSPSPTRALAVALVIAASLTAGACGAGDAADDRTTGSTAGEGNGGTTRAEGTTLIGGAQTADPYPGDTTVREGGAVLVRQGERPPRDPYDVPGAFLAGELVVGKGGCLRLGGEGPADDILVAPPGYSLGTRGGEVRLLDREGRDVAGVGDRVGAGGGEYAGPAPGYGETRRQLRVPERCPGPLWMAAFSVRRVEPG